MNGIHSLKSRALRATACTAIAMGFSCSGSLAMAQSGNQPEQSEETRSQSASDALLGDIVVTARKRPEDVQRVPLAITAFGDKQLSALNFRDLGSLTTVMPNVALDSNGTFKGFANFSIRGIGTNSSIPSTDPTVGLFVDGVYQGVSVGQVLDNFDLEAVEVLRGPQGIFFGRNVTGGAILVRTRKPTDTLEVRGRVGLESGLRVVADGSVSGPLVDDLLTAKLAGYYTHDAGYFHNAADGRKFGKDEQWVIRPALRLTPAEDVEILLRYEHGKQTGEGPASQNNALFSNDSFGFSINERGYVMNRWDSATMETNVGVGLGDGTITNIFGWRKTRSDSLGDIDGTTATVFHIIFLTDQEQFSNELRYAGTFGAFEVATGLYAFTQKLHYVENRILGAAQRTGGGDGRFSTLGAFAAVDWHFTDTLTLNLGARYSYERKRANIGAVRTGGGDVATRSFIPDFSDTHTWRDLTPRVGLQFQPSSLTQVYGFYTKGFRSGGYNFRNTTVGAIPGPVDAEAQNAFELGIKQALPGNAGHINVALFRNDIDHIQRDITVPSTTTGVAQVTRNVGDARIQGFEADVQVKVVRGVVLGGQLGYTDGKYRTLQFDLNGDDVINAADYALKVPRLAPWSYGVYGVVDFPIGDLGNVSTRLSYNHRDSSFFTDNNLGVLKAREALDANISFSPPNGNWTFTVYGTNLTDQAYSGNATVLSDVPAFGGDGAAGPRPLPTFSPLARGRVIGGEFRFQF
jgi:iron complex outermembrane receptor protein